MNLARYDAKGTIVRQSPDIQAPVSHAPAVRYHSAPPRGVICPSPGHRPRVGQITQFWIIDRMLGPSRIQRYGSGYAGVPCETGITPPDKGPDAPLSCSECSSQWQHYCCC